MRRLESATAGFEVLSEAVLVSAQRPMRRAVPVGLPVSEPSPAIELRKYSVPLAAVDSCPAGETAGQTVKPGEPSTRVFSTWTKEMDDGNVAPASCCLPIA